MENVYNWLITNKLELMNKFILRMIPNKRDAEDFYQDLFLIMSNKDENKLNNILDNSKGSNNEMMRFVFIIIKNNLKSKNSRYYYTYRKPIGLDFDEIINDDFGVDYNNDIKHNLLQEIENDYSKLMEKINKYFVNELKENPKSYYDKTIFELYYNKDNTYRALSKTLNIPITSIFNTVKKTKSTIMKVFKDDINEINNKLMFYYGDEHK